MRKVCASVSEVQVKDTDNFHVKEIGKLKVKEIYLIHIQDEHRMPKIEVHVEKLSHKGPSTFF